MLESKSAKEKLIQYILQYEDKIQWFIGGYLDYDGGIVSDTELVGICRRSFNIPNPSPAHVMRYDDIAEYLQIVIRYDKWSLRVREARIDNWGEPTYVDLGKPNGVLKGLYDRRLKSLQEEYGIIKGESWGDTILGEVNNILVYGDYKSKDYWGPFEIRRGLLVCVMSGAMMVRVIRFGISHVVEVAFSPFSEELIAQYNRLRSELLLRDRMDFITWMFEMEECNSYYEETLREGDLHWSAREGQLNAD